MNELGKRKDQRGSTEHSKDRDQGENSKGVKERTAQKGGGNPKGCGVLEVK